MALFTISDVFGWVGFAFGFFAPAEADAFGFFAGVAGAGASAATAVSAIFQHEVDYYISRKYI
jgi:hypothetical protein